MYSYKLWGAFILAAVCMHHAAYAQETVSEELTEERQREFSAKALDNINRLGLYFSVVAEKESFPEDIKDAIRLALQLFISEEAIVEVSSTTQPDRPPRKFTIKRYMERLMVLPYRRVEISWAEIAYISDLKRGTDGKYYGVATIEQRFIGYDENDYPIYEDVTIKHIQVVLQQIAIQGPNGGHLEWEVLLSDISVEQTYQS